MRIRELRAMKSGRNNTYAVVLPVIGGCLLFGLSLGIRMNYGILLNAYADRASFPYDRISLAVAVGELVYGITQPLFGMAAIRRSNGFVLKTGLLLLAAGFISSAWIRSAPLLVLSLGVCLSAGTGAVCFGIVMGAVSPFVPKNRAAAVSGIVNASSGIGSSLMSPLMERLMAALGLTNAMLALSFLALLLLPVACGISAANRRKNGGCTGVEEKRPSFSHMLKAALHEKTYQYLMIGFFTCGFHMSLIQNHLFSQIVSYGIDRQAAAFAYTAFGVGTMAGALCCGLVCSRLSLKNVLGSLYFGRVVIIGIFLFLLPENMPAVTVFAVALGLCGDATVTPTSEIISRKFGAANMAFLFGVVFVCHQIGGFISTWSAGILLGITGNYVQIWLIDLVLCGAAAIFSYRIKNL